MRAILPIIVAIVLFSLSAQVQAQRHSQPKLPPGYYIYIGRQLGGSAPKYFIVNDDGSFRWDSSTGPAQLTPMPMSAAPAMARPMPMAMPNQVDKQAAEPDTEPPARSGPPPKGEFETYEYPFIKWKPKMRPSGALVQLETRFEVFGGGGFAYGNKPQHLSGTLKYKVNVLVRGNTLIPSQGLRIDLLDDKGFDLCKLMAPGSEFSAITGTSLLEAHGTTNILEDDYKKAVDYSVK